MKNSQKGFANMVLIGVIVVLVAIGGYFVLSKKSEPVVQQPITSPMVATTTDETVNWKTYTNSEYGFELKYPETWIIKEDKEDTMLGSNIKNIFFNTSTKDEKWIKDNNGNAESIVFGVKIYTLKQYDDDQKKCVQAVKENYEPSDCLRMISDSNRNSKYVFVYYSPYGAGLNLYPADFNYSLFLVGSESFKTFKFTK